MKKILSLLICYFVFASTCFAATVVFNTKSKKYHNPNCQWAIKCTVNCIKTEKQTAKSRGGVPCKVCGGS